MNIENIPYIFLAILPLLVVYYLVKSFIKKKNTANAKRIVSQSSEFITDVIDTKEELEDVEKDRVRENDYGVSVVQVIPNSQFYDDLDQIINYVTYSDPIDSEYLLVALNNTKAKGYRLVKIDEETKTI